MSKEATVPETVRLNVTSWEREAPFSISSTRSSLFDRVPSEPDPVEDVIEDVIEDVMADAGPQCEAYTK